MKTSLFTLAVVFTTTFIFGQNLSNSSSDKYLSDADFVRAKELYLKMYNSESYQLTEKNCRAFGIKFGDVELDEIDDMNFALTEQGFLNWISLNLNKTKFKSIEEAFELRKSCIESQKVLDAQSIEVYRLIGLASKEQVKEILKPHGTRIIGLK